MMQDTPAVATASETAGANEAVAESVMLASPDLAGWLPEWFKPYWDFLAAYPVACLWQSR